LARKAALGEFEHLVLLAALRLRDQAYAPQIARVLEDQWQTTASTDERGGNRRRRFLLTEVGLAAVAAQRDVLLGMWRGIEDLLPDKRS